MHATSAPTAAGPRPNPCGTASLVCGILLLLFSFITTALAQAMPIIAQNFDLAISQAAVGLQLLSGVSALIALIAVALGIIGLVQKDRRRAAAIIGTTLGVAQLLSGAGAVLSGLLVGLAFG
ncbi:hypothetical protein [Brachybacterium hainanense]|uniref:DUF4190 domain-containing protein n=1 Tax=Brachybacterium hainanense TaxID=1541174 RepID=A0ABV6RAN3_9MICO